MDAAVAESYIKPESVSPIRVAPPVPPLAPLSMPVQELRRPYPGARTMCKRPRTVIARGFIFLATLFGSVAAVWQMIEAVGFAQATGLQIALVVLFAITFVWIAFPAAAAVYALVARIARPLRARALQDQRITGRTALVMPVYNEDPYRTFSALQSIAEGLVEAGHGDEFEIFVLSDTRDPDIWLRETQAYRAAASALSGRMRVYYRRRHDNRARKPGNIQDFVERWGGRYDYMIVLDADSLMEPDTIVNLTQAMSGDPDLGLLQTVPRLAGAKTLFARAQQFASSLYGPLVAEGVDAWQGDDGNFWGHNAIIRVDAFAAACGLPELRGRPPFGGAIMSHDFVEAALLRRAGWKVRMDPSLAGSWEEPPPTIADFAARDRRWAQGNLQHSKVILARGLAPANRLHMAMGMMSYLSSLIWLMLIMVGLGIAAQAKFIRPEYFPENFQLFPRWPSFDSERLILVFITTMSVLMLPKLLSLLAAIFSHRGRQDFGGAPALLAGFVVEVVFSVLIAPVMMLLQSRQILEILTGRTVQWSVQQREDGKISFAQNWLFHRSQVLIGVLVAAGAWLIAPGVFAWLTPVVAGLCLAPLTGWAGNSRKAGKLLERLGLLRTREEISPPPLFRARQRNAERLRQKVGASASFETLLESPKAREQHISTVLPPPPEAPGNPDPARLVAEFKIQQAACRSDALSWLSPSERVIVLAQPEMLSRLASMDCCKSSSAGLYAESPAERSYQ